MNDRGLALPQPDDGLIALASTLDWLRSLDLADEFGALVPQPLDTSGAPDTLAERLAGVGLEDWRDLIVATASVGQPIHLEARLVWLMGRAALEIALDADQPGLFQVVEKLQMLGGVSDAALASAVCSCVAGASREYPLVARLRTRLQTLWNSRFNERLRLYAETATAQRLTSRDLWPRYDGMPLGDGWAHRVAATLWPERYMEMLASFPTSFQHGFGDLLSPLELDLVVSLVRASPSVFSSDGRPLGPVVVFALLNAAEALTVQDMAAAETALDNVLDGVFSRNDGDWLGRAWLQQIIWRDTPRRAGRVNADVNAQKVIRNTLLMQLSARIAPLGDAAFDWVRQEEPLWGVHRILSEASILDAHGNATSAAEILAEAVRQGLVSATGRAAGLITDSPEATIVARVLSQLPDMKQWFATLWRDTYELREHLSYPAHRDLDNPAYPALAWGLTGLNSSQATHVDVAEFWRVISAAVFETQRIDPNASLFNGTMPPITRFTAQLGAVLVARGTVSYGHFAEFLVDQLEPTAEYARLWQIIRSQAPDDATLAVGRLVGAPRLRQALEAGLAQHLPGWDAVLDPSARDDLASFSGRL